MKLKPGYLIIILLLSFKHLIAADADSLKLKLQNAEGKERIKILIDIIEDLERTDPENAFKYANEVEKLLDINPDKELTAEVFLRKGWLYNYLNKPDSAIYFAESAGKLYNEIGNARGLVLKSILLARIQRDEDEYDKALKHLDDAREKNKEAEDPLLEIKILNETGSVYRRLSQFDEALKNHLEAIELLKQFNDDGELTSTYTYLGIIYNLKGNYDEALKYYHKALELNKKRNDVRGIAGSLHNIGILYQKIDKYDQSLEYYNQALQYWKDLNNKDGLASTLNSIGAVNELKQNYDEALNYYKQALQIWEESGSKYSISIGLNNIGSVQEYLGNYKEAANYLQRAIDIRKTLGDKNGMASSMTVLALVYNKMGNVQAAIKTAKESLILAKEAGSLASIREAHNVLSDIYESNGFYKEALAEYKNYKSVHDSMFNTESQETIAEMQEKYKSDEQKQQIEILQKKNEIQNLYRTILIAGLILVLIILILLYNRYRLKQRAANLRTEAAENKAAILQVGFEQKKKELNAARDLQLSMLPAKIPQHSKVDISALMLTATEVGGDYYDFHTAKDGTLTIAIGDATGHGAQAGIMVTAAKSLFNLLSDDKEITEILSRSTHAIRKMNFSNIFMTLGLLRLKDNELELAGAGMPPAYIYRSGSGKVEEVTLKGLPLGSVSEYNYPKNNITLYTGDVVAVMSDGFPELFNDKNETLGFEKIPLLLKEAGKKSPDEIINHFTNTAAQWLNGNKQQDDMTFVVFKMK